MSIGARLRAAREARGLSIDAVARTTRVQSRVLAAIERDEVSSVPPRPFGRGFVRTYAREVGLDGDQTARDYFAQFAPAVPPPGHETAPTQAPAKSRLRRGWPIVVVSVGVLTGITLALVTGRPAATTGPGPQQPAPGPIDPVAVPVPTDAAPAGTAPVDARPVVPTPADAPAAPPVAAAPLMVVLTATRPCWVEATSDGRRALYQTVVPGSPQTLAGSRNIEIRVGDAGALAWQVNGRDAGVMGRPGQVRDVRVTPATAATVR